MCQRFKNLPPENVSFSDIFYYLSQNVAKLQFALNELIQCSFFLLVLRATKPTESMHTSRPVTVRGDLDKHLELFEPSHPASIDAEFRIKSGFTQTLSKRNLISHTMAQC